jgi:hypothetical protein
MSVSNTLYINYTAPSPTTTVTANQTLIYGVEAPYVIRGYATKFNNAPFVRLGEDIHFA